MNWTLVTGAAKRLGKSIALNLAAQGHSIVVHYNTSESEAESVVKSCHALGVQCGMIQGDFSTQESTAEFIERYLSRFSTTKYLVNNVGNYLSETASRTSDEEWRTMFQTNFHVPFSLIQALVPSLRRERGCVVSIGFAGAGDYLGAGSCAAYCIAKNALWMLTRALALELAPCGVRVNMVSPGHLENTAVKIVDVQALPMRRLGSLNEVARAVSFFIDEQNAYITGQNIEVAGGIRL